MYVGRLVSGISYTTQIRVSTESAHAKAGSPVGQGSLRVGMRQQTWSPPVAGPQQLVMICPHELVQFES